MHDRPGNLLFLCFANLARSLSAEAILAPAGQGRIDAILDTCRMLRNRVSALAALPVTKPDRMTLQGRIDQIGRGGTAPDTQETPQGST